MTQKEFLAEVVALVVKGTPKSGESKVGGKPDVPADFEWPNEEDDDGAPLHFDTPSLPTPSAKAH